MLRKMLRQEAEKNVLRKDVDKFKGVFYDYFYHIYLLAL